LVCAAAVEGIFMKITIKLYSLLKSYLGENANGSAEREVPDGCSINDILVMLDIPEKIPKIMLINGEQMQATDRLAEGDVLSVFPPIAGG
jgi:sulfur carrier protein ThiS